MNLEKQKEGFKEAFGKVKTQLKTKFPKKKKNVVALRGITSPWGQKIKMAKKTKRRTKGRRKKKK